MFLALDVGICCALELIRLLWSSFLLLVKLLFLNYFLLLLLQLLLLLFHALLFGLLSLDSLSLLFFSNLNSCLVFVFVFIFFVIFIFIFFLSPRLLFNLRISFFITSLFLKLLCPLLFIPELLICFFLHLMDLLKFILNLLRLFLKNKLPFFNQPHPAFIFLFGFVFFPFDFALHRLEVGFGFPLIGLQNVGRELF